MTANRPQPAGMSTRQKIIAVIFIVVLIFLAYQIYALFGGGGIATPTPTTTRTNAGNAVTPPPPGNQMHQPTPAALTAARPETPLSPREAELMRLQQETEARYLSALNELQMLKINQEIAETNRAIMAAKLETVTSEKGIVDLLRPAQVTAPINYAQGLAGTTTTTQQPQTVPVAIQQSPDVAYTVVSVSQLQNRWSAVLGSQGRLFNVFVGDVLPPDQSKVLIINRSGVTLEKNGVRRKISLVSII